MKTIKRILTNKCPNCHEGHIYTDKNIYFNFFRNKMHKTCNKCGYKFEKEPGFFFGAMYISYTIGVAQALFTAGIGSYFYDTPLNLKVFLWIMLVLALMSSFNMRISRIIWIYLFKNNQ
ncbi:DUF983 domain-containing protein [uncultured Winogradskyella sp.]|uniref:DUF983 domain-containing protein n=1 Tax=uncultured Winogradskyella sp. TaxID=395353 RepID=UPI0026243775|nr:DUF983 domain-containing protein [uncultured Winogradskyella sp.]